MDTPSAIALTGFIAWTLFLLVLMELLRGRLVVLKRIPANQFKPDNSNLSPFMQRLARAHANCVEGLPLFGGLLLVALATGQTSLTDPLAYYLLAARLAQSLVHLASPSILAVNTRFACFAVQLAIATYWAIGLLSRALG
ncbi:MAPEG family protein [Pseudomonas sp. LS44]|uniref:MAPEG family protein n=1 Tax=Pseudomonas sp. LS44 TaxID=1357074 RepID=UPI00215A6920|nr:MAPEG family protein [Pseudomonas sp. LS44]UVE17861.1 MAPEG family protein [Pseudomonas sp. LS44]